MGVTRRAKTLFLKQVTRSKALAFDTHADETRSYGYMRVLECQIWYSLDAFNILQFANKFISNVRSDLLHCELRQQVASLLLGSYSCGRLGTYHLLFSRFNPEELQFGWFVG